MIKYGEEGVFVVVQKASEGRRDSACMLDVEDEAVMANTELESYGRVELGRPLDAKAND